MVCIERRFSIAIIIAVSLFVAVLGIVGSSYAKISKNRFCPPTVVETQVIETEGSVSKIDQCAAELYSPFFSFAPTAFYIESSQYEARNNPQSLTNLVSPRAPPSIN
jgi:hypothetical protein